MTDILLTAAAELDLTGGRASLVTGPDAVGQKLKIKLSAFQGDWFLNLEFGIPYFASVFQKNVNESDILQIYQAAAETVAGVVSINELTLTLPDDATRRLDVDVTVTTSTGDEVNVITNLSEIL